MPDYCPDGLWAIHVAKQGYVPPLPIGKMVRVFKHVYDTVNTVFKPMMVQETSSIEGRSFSHVHITSSTDIRFVAGWSPSKMNYVALAED
jgi:hypothetical protein